MKPIDITSKATHGCGARRQFPITNYNFQAPMLGGCGSCGSRTVDSESFWRFSREYFGAESDRSFKMEAAVFAILAITAAMPMIQNASAINQLVRAFGA